MSVFPETPTALLTRLARQVTGEDELVWSEFFELYTPVMRMYLLNRGVDEMEAEDVVQDVLAKLVSVLRENRYDKSKSRFRTYLSHVLYHEMIDHYRRASARREHMHVPLSEEMTEVAAMAGETLDREWAAAQHAAAVTHVLEKTALSEQSKRVYRELETSGETCEAVAKRFRLPATTVRQIKSRVGRMIAALERRLEG